MKELKIVQALEALGITEAEVPAVAFDPRPASTARERLAERYYPALPIGDLEPGGRVVVRAHGYFREALVVKVGRVNARVIYRAPAGRVHVQDARVGTWESLELYSPAVVAGAPRSPHPRAGDTVEVTTTAYDAAFLADAEKQIRSRRWRDAPAVTAALTELPRFEVLDARGGPLAFGATLEEAIAEATDHGTTAVAIHNRRTGELHYNLQGAGWSGPFGAPDFEEAR